MSYKGPWASLKKAAPKSPEHFMRYLLTVVPDGVGAPRKCTIINCEPHLDSNKEDFLAEMAFRIGPDSKIHFWIVSAF